MEGTKVKGGGALTGPTVNGVGLAVTFKDEVVPVPLTSVVVFNDIYTIKMKET